jgi:hypothetical protein
MVPVALSVGQAKANLLHLGEEAASQGGLRRQFTKMVGRAEIRIRKGGLTALVIAAIIGIVIGHGRPPRRVYVKEELRGRQAAKLGIRLGVLLRLFRPLMPILLRYLALQRSARAGVREQQVQHDGATH